MLSIINNDEYKDRIKNTIVFYLLYFFIEDSDNKLKSVMQHKVNIFVLNTISEILNNMELE